MTDTPPHPFTFPKSHHLRKPREFDAVYQGGIARTVGPLRVFGRPSGLSHPRLGLNVSKRVGNAVVRNRVKRLLREAFRLLQHRLPPSYDLIVIARPHATLTLEDYQRILLDAAGKMDREWKKKGSGFGGQGSEAPKE